MDLQLVTRSLPVLLLGAALVSLTGCGVVVRAMTGEAGAPDSGKLAKQAQPAPVPAALISPTTASAAPRPLTAEERRMAEVAWAYFKANQDTNQGLPYSVAGYASSTAWEAGDMVAALFSAHALKLIDDKELDYRFSLLLGFLSAMELVDGKLPNKTYDSRSGGMTRDGNPGMAGWSAVDTGRLLVWLRIAAQKQPRYAEYIRRAVGRLDLCAAIGPGDRLQGTSADGSLTRYPEALRGYERYAAIGYRLWGVAVAPPADAGAPLLTGPYTLAAMEVGLKAAWRGAEEEAASLTGRQAARTEAGTATARTEFLRNQAPYFVFATVEAGGQAWAVLEPGGKPQPGLGLVSTRAAFGLWALDPARFQPVLAVVQDLRDDGKGWFEGRYENTGTYEWTLSATTNAHVLQALAYRQGGTFLSDPVAAAPVACKQ